MTVRSTIALSLLTLVCGCSDESSTQSPAQVSALPVNVIRAVRVESFSYPLTFYGRVRSKRETTLAFELPGRVADVVVEEGDKVVSGQPLALLDVELLEAQRRLLIAKRDVEETVLTRLVNGERDEVIAAAKATVDRLNAEVKRELLNYNRVTKLRQTKAVSESQFEQAVADYDALRFSLQAAEARMSELVAGTREEEIEAQRNRVKQLSAEIDVIDVQLGKATLRTPFDAHIVRRYVDSGAVVEAGRATLDIVESGMHEARFSLPAVHSKRLPQEATIQIDGRRVDVARVRVVPRVDKQTRNVDVICELTDSEGVLSGTSCTLTRTVTVAQRCVVLPVSALVPSVRGLWSCFRVTETETGTRVVKEDVTVSHTDGDRVFVETSLPAGALVVADGVHKLVAGNLVEPVVAGEASEP